MELKFVETIEGKEWEAEFEAPSDFNLHLERVSNSSLVVYQRGSAEGEYAAAFVKGVYEGTRVIDYDFGALVYPKWIKVVSGSEVVSASVNFNEDGGSGSGSGEASTVEYLDVSGMNANTKMRISLYSLYIKSANGIMPSGSIISMWGNEEEPYNSITSISIDFDAPIKTGNISSINEFIKLVGGFTQEQLDAIPRITKEQFYSLE